MVIQNAMLKESPIKIPRNGLSAGSRVRSVARATSAGWAGLDNSPPDKLSNAIGASRPGMIPSIFPQPPLGVTLLHIFVARHPHDSCA